jgi:hypothetical protein
MIFDINTIIFTCTAISGVATLAAKAYVMFRYVVKVQDLITYQIQANKQQKEFNDKVDQTLKTIEKCLESIEKNYIDHEQRLRKIENSKEN